MSESTANELILLATMGPGVAVCGLYLGRGRIFPLLRQREYGRAAGVLLAHCLVIVAAVMTVGLLGSSPSVQKVPAILIIWLVAFVGQRAFGKVGDAPSEPAASSADRDRGRP